MTQTPLILIDNGHGDPPRSGGKQSPDGRVREYYWARDIASRLDRALTLRGLNSMRLVIEAEDISITERIRRVNAWCKKYGAKNVILVSIHNNAAGADGKWHDAHGWQVYVSKNASQQSRLLAQLMTRHATAQGLVNPKSRQPDGFWTWSWRNDDIAILSRTNCPAVLVENLFMDNLEDVRILTSDQGKNQLTQIMLNAILDYVNQ